MTIVKLSDIAEEMSFTSPEHESYFHKKSGNSYLISIDLYTYTDKNTPGFNDLAEWEQELVDVLIDTERNPGDYALFPSDFDINDYAIVEEFCENIADEKLKVLFLRKIRGSGAFRRFDYLLVEHNMREQWFEFKDKAYLSIAEQWCKENQLEYQ